MEREKAVTAFLAIVCIGIIISVIGMMSALGLDRGGFIYSAFHNAFLILNILNIVGIAVLYQDGIETEEDQSQVDEDMSIV